MLRTKITVIVPVYNVESYLPKCMESILNQTYSCLQIILIDDGSTDRSGNLCDQYARIDNRVVVFHTKNNGLVAARKLGLKHANGEYIGFVDADDYIETNMYETLLQLIVENNADFVHTGFIREDEKGIVTETVLGFENAFYELQDLKDREKFIRNYVLRAEKNSYMSFSIWSKLYKSELIKKCYSLLQNDQQYGEDLFSLCLCILQSKYILLNKSAMYHYVMKEDSMSHLKNTECVIKEIELCNNLVKTIHNYDCKIYLDLKNSICNFLIKKTAALLEKVKNGIHIQRFAFRDIENLRGKKIIIFGAGAVGRDYYSQFCRYKDIEIIAWMDSNWKNYQYDYAEIVGTEKISEYEFEKIVIAVEDEKVAMNIKNLLLRYDQLKEKIIWKNPMNLLECK